MLFLLVSIASAAYHKVPANAGWNDNTYKTGEEAAAACTTAGFGLCTVDQAMGAAFAYSSATSTGWYKTADGYARGNMQGHNDKFDLWAWDGITGGIAHCCDATYKNIGYGVLGVNNNWGLNPALENNIANAKSMCAGQAGFTKVCTVRQVREMHRNNPAVPPAVSSFFEDGSVGFFQEGAINRWDSSTVAWSGASNGIHCCSDDAYMPTSTYGHFPENGAYATDVYYNGDDASAACLNNGWDGLCTVGQLAGLNECKVGWAWISEDAKSQSKETAGRFHSPGYFGNCGSDGNGNAGQWNDHYDPKLENPAKQPIAHCCMQAVESKTWNKRVYRNGGYDKSSYYASKEDAQAQCGAMGTEYNLCSREQLERVATEDFEHNGFASKKITDMCLNGWTSTGDIGWYQVENGDAGCAPQGTGWNQIPNALGGTYHCCQNFAGVVPTVPVYETLAWAQFTKEQAEGKCRGDAELCTRDQLALLAREGVEYEGEKIDAMPNMCSLGWTKDAGLGWWQVEDKAGCVPLGLDQMNAFTTTMGTYHCCRPFSAPDSTRIFETRLYFSYTKEEARSYCNGQADLCTQEQLYRVASEDFEYQGKQHTAQKQLCSQGWTQDAGLGWWQEEVSAGCDKTGWDNFNAEKGTFFCCLPFAGKALPTEAPETEAPVTTAAPESTVTAAPESTASEAPEAPTTIKETEAATTTAPETTVATHDGPNNLPSAKANPEDCKTYDFAPAGFENEVSYCVSNGIVYLGGFSTCIPKETQNLNDALQNSWNNDWFFGTSEGCTERNADDTTQDQIWVVNKMCDNLSKDIDSLETSNKNYMDQWTKDIKALIEANMSNFSDEKQKQLNEFLATLN